MKKLSLFLLSISLIFIFTGCNKIKSIDLEDVRVNFSLYNFLPSSINDSDLNNKIISTSTQIVEKYHSESYYRLLASYKYINELFVVFDDILSNSVVDDNITLGKTYTYNDFNYRASIDKNVTSFFTTNTNNNRSLKVSVDYLDNGDKRYTGTHGINSDFFSFEIIDNKKMTINYNKESSNSEAYATIKKDDDLVKTHVIFTNGEYNYNIVSIASDDFVSIYYNYASGSKLNQNFEFYDKDGYLLYQSFNLNNGAYTASGWYTHALTNYQSIKKINNMNYLVDGQEFKFISENSNLYIIEVDYLNDDLLYEKANVLILGELNFYEDLVKIVNVRKPFETNYYNIVSNFAEKTMSFYYEVKTK